MTASGEGSGLGGPPGALADDVGGAWEHVRRDHDGQDQVSRRRGRKKSGFGIGTVVLLLAVVGALVAWGRDGVTSVDAEAGTALAAVGQLDVKGRAPMTGYDRDEFGPAWSDTDHNGCDPRIISSRLVH